ncbi:MAG: hypothetical protein F4Y26_07415 [Gammaproteobacteria bacterium]|nr:hypothetical protein [Gammaproteobacteria bacterium]
MRLYFSTDGTIDPAGDVGSVAFDSRPGATVTAAAPAASSAGEITFKLSLGVFAETVGSDALAAANADGTASTNATISIANGGATGDDSVTFLVTIGDAALADDSTFTFVLPRLKGLSALGAGHVSSGSVSVTTRGTQGTGFPTGGVGTYFCAVAGDSAATPAVPDSDACNETMSATTARARMVVKDAEAVLFSHYDTDSATTGVQKSASYTGDNSVRINIDNRMMLRANAWSGAFGYRAGNPYNPNTFHVMDGDGESPAARLLDLSLTVRSRMETTPLLQWDGTKVDSDVAGVLDVDITGTRGLFGDGDRVFVNFGPHNDTRFWATGHSGASTVRSIDSGESLTVDGSMASFTVGGLSIDPGDVDEDDPTETRIISVYYIPGGEMELAHGTKLSSSAVVNYTRATSNDEGTVRDTTELRLHGVDDELKAYAVPFDGNGRGDKANLRVRCEDGDVFSAVDPKLGDQCRAFLECWNDAGDRMFGEILPAIAENAVTRLNAMQIENDVLGMEDMATSRHSCRVLATGLPSVQILVNSGGTLVNNTYVEDM